MRVATDQRRRLRRACLASRVLPLVSAVALLLPGSAVLSAEISGEPPPSFAEEDGRRLFRAYCAPCHGDSGRGDGRFRAPAPAPPVPDFTAPSFIQRRSAEDLFRAIHGGSASLGKSDYCPAWGETFRKEEIEHLVAYIRRLQRRAQPPVESAGQAEPAAGGRETSKNPTTK